MHLIPLVLYGCAAGTYLAHFAGRDRSIGRLATALLGAAVLAHTFIIGMQTVQVGHAPLVGTTAAVSAFVWLLGLAYLYVELTTDERAMGVLVTIMLALLYIIPALDPQVSSRPEVLRSPLFTVHVLAMLFAYASFALACVLGVTYVLLFNEIKAKHLGFFYARLPSLQVLDVMNGRVVTIGWIFLTIGIAVGGIWATPGAGLRPIRGCRRCRSVDPKILVALVSWGVYSFALFARRAIGWTRPAGRLAVGAGVRDRAAQFRARRVLPDEEPQLLMTRLFTVGLSHRTAPVELRESVDFSRGGAGEALAALAGRGISKEMVVLSTCNRAEIYAVAGPDGPRRHGALLRRVSRAAAGAADRAPVRAARRGSRAASVPRRRRPRLAGRRRAADPRAGQGGLLRRQRPRLHRRRSSTGCSTPPSASASACAGRPA